MEEVKTRGENEKEIVLKSVVFTVFAPTSSSQCVSRRAVTPYSTERENYGKKRS